MRLRRLKRLLNPRSNQPAAVKKLLVKSYRFTPRPRPYGESMGGKIVRRQLEQGRKRYEELCREIVGERERLSDIPNSVRSDDNPHWKNGWFPPLDGMILYTLIRMLKPRTYLEIGSGNSTKFARKAVRDHRLATRIISIDPSPRAEIDALCDRTVRKPFQDVAEDVAGWIEPGDIVFQDGSHHVFTNSDATVFFTEFLPILPRGVTWGMHDIFLPNDYPEFWHGRFYNEQYLLAVYLLAGAAGDEILFPSAFIGTDAALCAALDGIFDLPALQGARPGGGAFWMRRP